MPEHDLDTLLGWRGRTVVDHDGEKLGKLGELLLDEDTDLPAYATVRTGLLGRRESIVPLDGITEREGVLVVPHPAERVRNAPSLDPDDALDEDEQARLAGHYGEPSREMLRSEEEVTTGTTEMRPRERVRLRKVLVTEEVRKTVPVRREEIRLETDPPPEGEIERVEDVPDR